MIAYASAMGRGRNLEAVRAAGWRIMITAADPREPPGDIGYCIDNGAWTAHVRGSPFDETAFLKTYERHGPGADFVVVPDIVAGGKASLEFSVRWLERLGRPLCPLLLAVQDGLGEADIGPLVGDGLGIFIGGSTPWKLATAQTWGRLALLAACWCHMGRVNTVRRIAICAGAGIHSFDGSSVSRFAVTLPKLDNGRRQGDLRL